LNVVIGNGQVGSTTFQNIDDDIFMPEVENSFIGEGWQITGKSLNVVSVVMEVNPVDDDMIISYWISDAPIDDLTEVEPTDMLPYSALKNETVSFITRLNFIK
ncbi:MAG TPA: hypothetical protein VMY77_05705, partial [Chitinophagaceae bacterium]|nr:hypothetical protein [Chitinophagaceae bacterium]